jgi:hypothetical protein
MLPRCLLLLVISCACVYAQQPKDADKPVPVEEQGTVIIVLVDSGPLIVDEVTETNDGYWYKRGTVTTFLDRGRVARIEYPKLAADAAASERPESNLRWRLADAGKVKEFFQAKFNRPLPLSAFGQSDLHTRWGLDHRNGMDVNLHPDSAEGRALIEFLRAESIPFLVFRGPIPGVATGPHIHVGNRSPRSYGR